MRDDAWRYHCQKIYVISTYYVFNWDRCNKKLLYQKANQKCLHYLKANVKENEHLFLAKIYRTVYIFLFLKVLLSVFSHLENLLTTEAREPTSNEILWRTSSTCFCYSNIFKCSCKGWRIQQNRKHVFIWELLHV